MDKEGSFFLTCKITVLPAQAENDVLQLAIQAHQNKQENLRESKRQNRDFTNQNPGDSSDSEEEVKGEEMMNTFSHFHEGTKNAYDRENSMFENLDDDNENDTDRASISKKDGQNFLNKGVRGALQFGGTLAGVNNQGAKGNLQDENNKKKIAALDKQVKDEQTINTRLT